MDDTEVINFLLSTEIIPLCLRTMETGSELSKTVATFIVQKILLDGVGLSYICATAERFFAVGAVLSSMVTGLAEQPSVRLLKHIIRCYLRLRCARGAQGQGPGWGGRGVRLAACLPFAAACASLPPCRGCRTVPLWQGLPFPSPHQRTRSPPFPPAATTRVPARRCASACPTCCATLSSLRASRTM